MLDADTGLDTARHEDAGLARALAIAYRYLNARERTQAEMRGHLRSKGIDPRDVERSVQALVDQGHLDDARFARLFVQDKRELEAWGADRIRQTLLSRGVDRDAVDEALAEHARTSDGGEIDRALEVLRRRFPSPVGDRRERERALGVLLRKGYETDLALEAITVHVRDSDPV
ncbi:MAG TPA: regulatory protein RecX [Solirubrobacteraceae bacterium]|nr:regulatory protein RecX [Solirubrobacteraceae bacterium]